MQKKQRHEQKHLNKQVICQSHHTEESLEKILESASFCDPPNPSSSKTALTQQLTFSFIFFKPFIILSDPFLTQPSE